MSDAIPSGRSRLHDVLPAVLLILVAIAVAGPWIAPFDPVTPDYRNRLAGISPSHLLGTDQLGRDIASRILTGARASLGMALGAATIATLVGMAAGVLGATMGGRVDWALTRLAEIFQSFPGFIVAVAVLGAYGPSPLGIVVTLAATGWMGHARLVRGLVRSLAIRDHVVAARLYGVAPLPLVRVHMLPLMLPPIIVMWSENWSRAILSVCALGFLGLGVAPPDPEWGAMLADGRSHMGAAPLVMIGPGATILVCVLLINLAGDWMRDRVALDEVRAA